MTSDLDVQCFGVVKRSAASEELQLCLEEIKRNGFSAMPDVFSAGEMELARSKIDELYTTQALESGGVGALGTDEDIVRCPLAYDPFFLDVAVHERILSVIRAILGEAFVLVMQNALINRANKPQYQVKWHRDLSYQHWVSTQPLAMNFLVCVDNFTVDAGCTWVLPASHHVAEFPSDDYVRKFQRPIELKSGSVIVLDAMTYHRAGFNRIPGNIRRAINHVVGLPFVAQQIDMPRVLADRNLNYSDDPFLSAYLGYRWNASRDAATWRSARRDKSR
jgi:ectoine hydroxylase-related dioxygenase (phytanoyl-CoA dioxygenase family)